MTIKTIQPRRGTAAAWTSANPVLAEGELGYETDTGLSKRGDGSSQWNDVRYEASAIAVDVRSYGATANGTTDDSGAFQDAIDAVGAAGGGTVFIPRGTYLLSNGLVFDTTRVALIGAGFQGTVILNYDGNDANAITITTQTGVRLENFRLIKTGGTGTNGIVFNYTATAITNYRWMLTGLNIMNFASGNGLVLNGVEQARIEEVEISGCDIGFYSTTNPSGGGGALNNTFTRCRAIECVTRGWDLNYMDASVFEGCQALNNGSGSSTESQFIMRGGCVGNTLLGLDCENAHNGGAGYGALLAGSSHTISLSSYSLDYGVVLSSMTGATVLPGKYSSVTTSVWLTTGATKNIVFHTSAQPISDTSGNTDNIVIGQNGIRTQKILDTKGGTSLDIAATTDAVNYLTVTNKATGAHPQISATGADGSLHIDLTPKGSGVVRINGSTVLTQTANLTGITNKTFTSPKITSGNAPASSVASGTVGQIEWDTSYLYVCTATNVWKRVLLDGTAWP